MCTGARIEDLSSLEVPNVDLEGLTESKYGDRSNASRKALWAIEEGGRIWAGPRFPFHSEWASTQLENALVPERNTADISGHEKPNITYGIYGGGASLAVKRDTLAKLSYWRLCRRREYTDGC